MTVNGGRALSQRCGGRLRVAGSGRKTEIKKGADIGLDPLTTPFLARLTGEMMLESEAGSGEIISSDFQSHQLCFLPTHKVSSAICE